MMKPLALVFYERLLPGSQLVNRLQDLGYRVQTLEEAALIPGTARDQKPIVLIIDLITERSNIFEIIKEIKRNEETSHLPIIGFADQNNKRAHNDAMSAGATLVAVDDALLPQLSHLLEHALMVE